MAANLRLVLTAGNIFDETNESHRHTLNEIWGGGVGWELRTRFGGVRRQLLGLGESLKGIEGERKERKNQ